MKFTNSPFAILDKNMNALDYQKRNLIYEDYWRREGVYQKLLKNLNKESKYFSDSFLIQIPIFLLLIK